jgi:hypothetical protein
LLHTQWLSLKQRCILLHTERFTTHSCQERLRKSYNKVKTKRAVLITVDAFLSKYKI